jgi:hypothetical protein
LLGFSPKSPKKVNENRCWALALKKIVHECAQAQQQSLLFNIISPKKIVHECTQAQQQSLLFNIISPKFF